MVELVEYSMVVLASALFAGASVATYSSFTRFEGDLAAHAAFSELSTLAMHAVDNGTSRSSISLPGGSIACHAGLLTFTTGALVLNQTLRTECSFDTEVTPGMHTVTFTEGSSGLLMKVG